MSDTWVHLIHHKQVVFFLFCFPKTCIDEWWCMWSWQQFEWMHLLRGWWERPNIIQVSEDQRTNIIQLPLARGIWERERLMRKAKYNTSIRGAGWGHGSRRYVAVTFMWKIDFFVVFFLNVHMWHILWGLWGCGADRVYNWCFHICSECTLRGSI